MASVGLQMVHLAFSGMIVGLVHRLNCHSLSYIPLQKSLPYL
jgi:hypothetical protein